ncbi:basic leucine zipper 34-like [Populus alba x Populus x berolinensis]|nr:basic leucine zipper 34-like [Populus alba x Populus x berolinensis]
MSRQSLLPPRCPFRKHVVSHPIHESSPQHHRSPSQGSVLEEKPAWLDDLLSDEDADSKGKCLRRSASDSVTLLDGIVDSFSGLSPYNDEAASGGNETCSGLESASMYGPNSPRRRGNVTFSENAIASALSEYAFQNPLQYVDGSLCISGIKPLDQMGNACGSAGEFNGETNPVKRHSGQRSRVRKLQYIAELERTVNVLQVIPLRDEAFFSHFSLCMIESLFAGIACSNFILDADGETLIFVHDKSQSKSYQLVLRNFQSYPIEIS